MRMLCHCKSRFYLILLCKRFSGTKCRKMKKWLVNVFRSERNPQQSALGLLNNLIRFHSAHRPIYDLVCVSYIASASILLLTNCGFWAETGRLNYMQKVGVTEAGIIAPAPVYIWWGHNMETLPHYRPFLKGIHRSPSLKASNADLWNFRYLDL